ncbi:hypothetical protein D3C78_19820 [compost metagenome]
MQKLIGKGSSRKVYDLGDGTVKKVAIGSSIKGIMQNRTEYDVFNSVDSQFLVPVLSIEHDSGTLIMQKAIPLTQRNMLPDHMLEPLQKFKRNLSYMRNLFGSHKY